MHHKTKHEFSSCESQTPNLTMTNYLKNTKTHSHIIMGMWLNIGMVILLAPLSCFNLDHKPKARVMTPLCILKWIQAKCLLYHLFIFFSHFAFFSHINNFKFEHFFSPHIVNTTKQSQTLYGLWERMACINNFEKL